MGPDPIHFILCTLASRGLLVDRITNLYSHQYLTRVGADLQYEHSHTARVMMRGDLWDEAICRMCLYVFEAAMQDCGQRLVGYSIYGQFDPGSYT